MKIIGSIEARMGSSRLPGKSLKEIIGRPMLGLMIERIKKAELIDEIVIATTTNSKDDPIEELAEEMSVGCFRGSEEDVLDRVLQGAKKFEADHILELWGDCPVIDPEILDYLIRYYLDNDYDCVGNSLDKKYPWGISALIFSTKVLDEVSQITNDPVDRENVSNYIYEHPEKYSTGNLPCAPELNRPDLRLCVDEQPDFDLIEKIYQYFLPDNPDFNTLDIIKYLDENPEIRDINKDIHQKRLRK